MMNIKTIAVKIGRPLGTVRHWATHGKIPARKVGDQWFAELKATEAYALKRPRHGLRKSPRNGGPLWRDDRSPFVAMAEAVVPPRHTSSQAILEAIRGIALVDLLKLPIPSSVVVRWMSDGCPTR